MEGNRTGVPTASASGAPSVLPREVEERYDYVSTLGSGGEGTVFLVREKNSGVQRAVKVYIHLPQFAVPFGSPLYQQRFGSRFVVEVFERTTSADGRLYEVMEYYPHGTLADVLTSGRSVDGKWIKALLLQVAQGLDAVQGAGSGEELVHGDLKPDNILVRDADRPEVVISDFGLTVALDGRSQKSNNGKGSAAYSAPGAADGFRVANDWWSLGMIMYRVLVGRDYFQGATGKPLAPSLIYSQLSTHDVSLDAVRAKISAPAALARWEMLLRGLLTRDPGARWGSQHVAAWARDESPDVLWLPGDPLYAGVAQSQPPASPPQSPSGPPPPPQRRPLRLENIGTFDEPEDLGRWLAANPYEAPQRMTGRMPDEIVDWLRAECGMPMARLPWYEETGWMPEEKVAYFISVLVPTQVIDYRGISIGGVAEFRAMIRDVDPRDHRRDQAWSALYTSRLLRTLAGRQRAGFAAIDESWHRAVPQAHSVLNDSRAARTISQLSDLNNAKAEATILALAWIMNPELETLARNDLRSKIQRSPDVTQLDWFAFASGAL